MSRGLRVGRVAWTKCPGSAAARGVRFDSRPLDRERPACALSLRDPDTRRFVGATQRERNQATKLERPADV